MLKNYLFLMCIFALFIFAACSGKSEDLRSMEQIRLEEGVPVVLREMRPSTFTTFLRYPAAFVARAESTATAGTRDVVRNIHRRLGDTVRRDEVVMRLSQDAPGYQQARANLANAEATYRRTQSLFADNGVSQQNLDNARTQYELAQAAFKAIDDIINVKAPIDGIITRLDVRVTENVQSGDVLFTVSNLDAVEARIWVSARDIGLIATGRPVSAEWLGQTITGAVSQVNMIMDTDRRAFLVLAAFSNPGRLLTSGMNLDVSLETYRNDDALYVHRRELISEAGMSFVFVCEGDIAVRRQVALGRTQGLLVEITDGLFPGEFLIVGGSQMVRDGTKVYAVAPLSGSSGNE